MSASAKTGFQGRSVRSGKSATSHAIMECSLTIVAHVYVSRVTMVMIVQVNKWLVVNGYIARLI